LPFEEGVEVVLEDRGRGRRRGWWRLDHPTEEDAVAAAKSRALHEKGIFFLLSPRRRAVGEDEGDEEGGSGGAGDGSAAGRATEQRRCGRRSRRRRRRKRDDGRAKMTRGQRWEDVFLRVK
jgi:hypothetical protein